LKIQKKNIKKLKFIKIKTPQKLQKNS